MITSGRSNQLFVPILSAHLFSATVLALSIPITVSASIAVTFSVAAVVALNLVSVIYLLGLCRSVLLDWGDICS
jgi:hypothetical protein